MQVCTYVSYMHAVVGSTYYYYPHCTATPLLRLRLQGAEDARDTGAARRQKLAVHEEEEEEEEEEGEEARLGIMIDRVPACSAAAIAGLTGHVIRFM